MTRNYVHTCFPTSDEHPAVKAWEAKTKDKDGDRTTEASDKGSSSPAQPEAGDGNTGTAEEPTGPELQREE